MSDPRTQECAHGPLPCVPAICYSGYRDGQSPGSAVYPDIDQIAEDLRLLQRDWSMIRLYDCGPHAQRVLQAIRRDHLPLRVLLGAYLEAELDNPNCPWGGRHDPAVLRRNRARNDAEVHQLADLVRDYHDIVVAAAIGNEASVDWTDHLVAPQRVRELVLQARDRVDVPLTVCDNHVPWLGALGDAVADVVDFISIHSYPVWEDKALEHALEHTLRDHAAVARRFAPKQVVITEAGWPTAANDRGIAAHRASEQAQQRYLHALLDWSARAAVPCFVFEAFDEAWKGSDDPGEPEKHWGLFDRARQPKLFAAA